MTDTPDTPDEVTEAKGRYEAIQATNMKKESRLSTVGGQVNPSYAQDMRLAILYEALFPQDTKARWDMEISYQEALGKALDMGITQGMERQLQVDAIAKAEANGLSAPKKGLFLPGRID